MCIFLRLPTSEQHHRRPRSRPSYLLPSGPPHHQCFITTFCAISYPSGAFVRHPLASSLALPCVPAHAKEDTGLTGAHPVRYSALEELSRSPTSIVPGSTNTPHQLHNSTLPICAAHDPLLPSQHPPIFLRLSSSSCSPQTIC
jgi:hypothetical protein